jgi:hypothetical protein
MNAAITNRINGISEDDKILSETSKAFIRLIINNLHIYSDDLGTMIINYSNDVQYAKSKDDFTILNHLTRHQEIIKKVRDELGIEELSSELLELYSKFPAAGLLKSKDSVQ